MFLVALTSEHNETLDAEKHGSCVSPAESERMSCAAILILLTLCVTLLVAWTVTRLVSYFTSHFLSKIQLGYMSNLEPKLFLCSSGRQIAL